MNKPIWKKLDGLEKDVRETQNSRIENEKNSLVERMWSDCDSKMLDETLDNIMTQIEARKNNEIIMFFLPLSTTGIVCTIVINQIIMKFGKSATVASLTDATIWGQREYHYKTIDTMKKHHYHGWYGIEYKSLYKLLIEDEGRIQSDILDPFMK